MSVRPYLFLSLRHFFIPWKEPFFFLSFLISFFFLSFFLLAFSHFSWTWLRFFFFLGSIDVAVGCFVVRSFLSHFGFFFVYFLVYISSFRFTLACIAWSLFSLAATKKPNLIPIRIQLRNISKKNLIHVSNEYSDANWNNIFLLKQLQNTCNAKYLKYFRIDITFFLSQYLTTMCTKNRLFYHLMTLVISPI